MMVYLVPHEIHVLMRVDGEWTGFGCGADIGDIVRVLFTGTAFPGSWEMPAGRLRKLFPLSALIHGDDEAHLSRAKKKSIEVTFEA
ncbi:unnamed protein product [Cuscuta campestris]|uniref:Uncharacterized protein n=1 Tax=Cuscuta campestris TaxID=132261 RepID=A0A484KPG0_9ASTE|nr:unnamed protein product [Cuscuta campestris]